MITNGNSYFIIPLHWMLHNVQRLWCHRGVATSAAPRRGLWPVPSPGSLRGAKHWRSAVGWRTPGRGPGDGISGVVGGWWVLVSADECWEFLSIWFYFILFLLLESAFCLETLHVAAWREDLLKAIVLATACRGFWYLSPSFLGRYGCPEVLVIVSR